MNEKNKKIIISLLECWKCDPGDYDKIVWEYLKREMNIYGVPDKTIRDDKNYKKAE